MNSRTLSTVNRSLATPMTRRSALRAFATAGVGAAALAVGGAGMVERPQARSTDSLIVNTEGARLRSGPGPPTAS